MAFLSRFIRSAFVASTTCAALITFTAPAALAHDALKSSSPAKNAKVSAVETIELEFTARIQLPTIILRDGEGKSVALDKARAEDRTVTSTVNDPLPPGKYVIGYRVVSSDGHPLVGEIPFTVIASKSSTPTPEPSVSATSASPSAAPVTSEAAFPASSTPVAATEDSAPSGTPVWIWLLVAALVVIGAVIAFQGARRKRTGDTE